MKLRKYLLLSFLAGLIYAGLFTKLRAQGGGAPMITDDASTLDAGHWEIDAAIITSRDEAGARQTQAPLLEINYGLPNANHATVFVAEDLGLFEKAGLKPKFYTFLSGAPLLAGLKSESLDVVTAGLALALALGQDIPLKFIYWEANSAISEG